MELHFTESDLKMLKLMAKRAYAIIRLHRNSDTTVNIYTTKQYHFAALTLHLSHGVCLANVQMGLCGPEVSNPHFLFPVSLTDLLTEALYECVWNATRYYTDSLNARVLRDLWRRDINQTTETVQDAYCCRNSIRKSWGPKRREIEKYKRDVEMEFAYADGA